MTKLASFEAARSARGDKRVCEACETRFYDLLRSPIVCPSCGALFTPRIVQVKPPVVPRPRWRKDFVPRPRLVAEEVDAKTGVPSDQLPDDELNTEDVKNPLGPEDDSIPEEIQEDTDVSGLLDVGEAKDG